ncbi:MAG: glycosyltransferase [Candidatus Marinimicrobia bacterium]|nr:glycosyltransferase [Candidatus Neomarinimicrobiota bacterium]
MDLKEFPTISVVVACFNVEHVIELCIKALLKQDYPKDKLSIIIVDDKSTDDTSKIIQIFHENEQIKIVKHFKNRGLAAARNSGIKASKSQIVGFIDSDMVVKNNWVNAMVYEISKNGVVACMGGIKLADSLIPNDLDKFLYNPTRGVLKHGENRPIRFKWFLFNNTAVKRTVIDEIGLFNESITSYGGEDTDFAIRIWDKYPEGLRFTFKATGEHFHQRPLSELKKKMENYGKNNYLRILERYPNHSKDLAGDWINSLKGRIVFNPAVNWCVRFLYFMIPIPYLVRYFIAYSLMLGARNPAEGSPRFQK